LTRFEKVERTSKKVVWRSEIRGRENWGERRALLLSQIPSNAGEMIV
jgi:hypothetical protein